MRAEAEELPFEDESFDLVFGHAVVHHIPELERAFAEFHRVLRPGGTIAFCGEPSRYGDRLAAIPKRAASLAAPAWRRLVGAPARRPETGRATATGTSSRATVDVHTFTPGQLQGLLDGAGFVDVRAAWRGAGLANAYGWLAALARGDGGPRRAADALAGLRLPQLPRAAEARRRGAGAATSRPRSSTTCLLCAQAG